MNLFLWDKDTLIPEQYLINESLDVPIQCRL